MHFKFCFVKISWPYNPKLAVTSLVWAFPRPLATTNGITNCFLFLRVLRCFSSPGLPPFGYYTFSIVGCPIRISTDQFVCANPRSFSQLITSFIASESLGIPHTPLFTFSYVLFAVVNFHCWSLTTCSVVFYSYSMSKNFIPVISAFTQPNGSSVC